MKSLKKIFFLFFVLTTVIGKSQTNDWKIFKTNTIYYNVELALPSYFSVGLFTNSQIQYYTSELTENDPYGNTIVAIEMEGKMSRKDFEEQYKYSLKTEHGIKYKFFKNDMYVISSINDYGTIFYEKVIYKNGQVYRLSIQYTLDNKEIFDTIIPRISKSFK
jgi:hypothetical protein